jgi:hypothetical protein
VHAAKTGRFMPWGWIILLIPGFGALAYVLAELVPEWFGSAQGQRARRNIVLRKRHRGVELFCRQFTDGLFAPGVVA